jgi:hypothetical protein
MVVTSNGGHGAAKSMESPVLVSFLGLSNRIKIELYFIIKSDVFAQIESYPNKNQRLLYFSYDSI